MQGSVASGTLCIRYQGAHNLHKLYKQYNGKQTVKTYRNENKNVNQIRKKLAEAKAMVTKADKGNSVIILYESECNNKVQTTISPKFHTTSLKNYNATSGQPSTNVKISSQMI
jgi:hypothetical protein